LKALGFNTLTRDADHYGYSLALGGAEVTLLDLANAYRTLANAGVSSPVRTVPGGLAHEPVQVMAPGAAYIVGDILSDPAARALTFGLDGPLATRYAASVKTGTSKDMRDNWAIGYTARYTVGVWVGNFSGAPMHDVSGVSGAAPVWRDIMDFLHEGDAPPPPATPPGLVRQRIAFEGNSEPGREEWFLAGTETARIVPVVAAAGRARIAAPANGAVYAIDPDIPRARQRITLSARGAQHGASFVLDGGRRVPADAPFLWLPQPGVRQVALVDASGTELDRVRFEVRGLRHVSRNAAAGERR
jgi:penicillin-binding protein 1C